MRLVDAIRKFLVANVADHLLPLYNEKMEVQVQAAQDGGTIESREFVTTDERTVGYTVFKDSDGNEWKTHRIPFCDGNDEPSFNLDKKLSWDFAEHLEGIALSGWNWVDHKTEYVVFDFDSIVNHSTGLSDSELQSILDAVAQVPWVSIWRSTSGTGYHIRTAIENPPTTKRRCEHKAVAHAVLNRLSAVTGIELTPGVEVDCFGMLHWVWHRKSEGVYRAFDIIKLASEKLPEVPYGWEEYITDRTRNNRANVPTWVPDEEIDTFEGVRTGNPKTALDFEHRKLLNWLIENRRQHWWDRENWLCVCHTADLRDAKNTLKLRGIFETIATGKNDGADHNCFMHPMPQGAWAVRRFGTTTEAATWVEQNGYALCYFNREPEFVDALNHVKAAKVSSRGYRANAAQLSELAQLYRLEDFVVPFEDRSYSITKVGKDKPVIKVKKKTGDDAPKGGWSDDDTKWVIVFDVNDPQKLVAQYVGDTIRAVNTDSGIHYYAWNPGGNCWNFMTRTNVSDHCASLGMAVGETKSYIGLLNRTAWKCVSIPFQPEYPGGKMWNRNRATFAYRVSKASSNYFPTYERLLTHIGRDLDDAVARCPECQRMGIKTGRDWLFCWLAILVQHPAQKTHYLYLWSPDQETGKTTFHEQISKLFVKGDVDATTTMTSEFNAELEGKVLATIEETNLGGSSRAYETIKKLTATENLSVHRKNMTPYPSTNYLKFIHCTNQLLSAPIKAGDLRCVIIRVRGLFPHEYIDKRVLEQRLHEESPDFLSALVNFKLPPPYKRFWLPLPETADRIQLLSAKEDSSVQFIDEQLHASPGKTIPFHTVYQKYQEWCAEISLPFVTKQVLQVDILRRFVIGRHGRIRDVVGNVSFEAPSEGATHYLVNDQGSLRRKKL